MTVEAMYIPFFPIISYHHNQPNNIQRIQVASFMKDNDNAMISRAATQRWSHAMGVATINIAMAITSINGETGGKDRFSTPLISWYKSIEFKRLRERKLAVGW